MSSVLPTDGHQPFYPASFFHLHRRTTPVDKQRKIALFLSYAPDWILTLLVAGLFFLLNMIEPFKREFSLEDTSIQHTFAVHERVSDTALFLIALVAPLILMAIINIISIRSIWDLHTSWLGGMLALSITGSITNVFKVTVGRPRPDCIDRCQPQQGSVNHPVFGLVNAGICTQVNNSILKDGFRSFPSGHSSLSFAGLGFLALYLAGKLHLFDERGHTAKAWISVVPLMGAALVAISRTMDYRHHWQDVLVGSLLGLLLAWFSYRQYYPPLSHPLSHRPYSPRISRNRTPLPHIYVHEGNHCGDEPENLHLIPNPQRREQNEETSLHVHPAAKTDPLDAASPLPDIWKQGPGTDITPPRQSHSQTSGPGNERV